MLIPPPARRGGVAVQPGGKKSSVSQRFGNQRGKKKCFKCIHGTCTAGLGEDGAVAVGFGWVMGWGP